GNVGPVHEPFREGLARLDPSRPTVGSEHGKAGVAERIADARVDSRLRAQDDEPQALVLGEIHEPHDIRGADADVSPHAAGAAVAGRTVDALDEIRLHALPDERVLARAGADDEDLQAVPKVSRDWVRPALCRDSPDYLPFQRASLSR